MKPGDDRYELLLEQVKRDECGDRKEYVIDFSFLDSIILKMIEDERDKIMVYLVLNMLCITVTSALAVFLVRPFSHLLAIGYLILNYVLFLQRYILMLHFSEHRRLFKKEYDYLNLIIPYLLSPFFGVPSGVYKLHHVVMHHLENNVFPWDISSTEPYHRAYITGYLKYWCYWFFAVWVLTPYYLMKRKRYNLFRKCAINLIGFFVVLFILYKINPYATIYVYVIPLFIATLALSFGNYSQHIFINPEKPKSNFGLAYNCVDCPDNMKTFNDGYHIVHHIYSQLHWSLLPSEFIKNFDKYVEEDAITFRGIGFFDVGFYVVTGQLKKLAKHYVPISDKYKNEDEIVNMFKQRLQKIEIEQTQ